MNTMNGTKNVKMNADQRKGMSPKIACHWLINVRIDPTTNAVLIPFNTTRFGAILACY